MKEVPELGQKRTKSIVHDSINYRVQTSTETENSENSQLFCDNNQE